MTTINNASLLKLSRENKKLTIAQLAAQTKLAEKRISDLENNLYPVGEAIPTYIKGQIRLICNVLEISSDEVITEITNSGHIFFQEPTCTKASQTKANKDIFSIILEAIENIKTKILAANNQDNTKTGL